MARWILPAAYAGAATLTVLLLWQVAYDYAERSFPTALMFGLPLMAVGGPGAWRLARRRLSRGGAVPVALALLVAPVLLGLLPGRVEEVVIAFRCRQVLEVIDRHRRSHGRPPAELAPDQLPPGCVYRYDPVGNTFTLFFPRPSLPSAVVYYHSAAGWGAHD